MTGNWRGNEFGGGLGDGLNACEHLLGGSLRFKRGPGRSFRCAQRSARRNQRFVGQNIAVAGSIGKARGDAGSRFDGTAACRLRSFKRQLRQISG